jgi:hypothetical protein
MSRHLTLREVADMLGMKGPTAPRRIREQLLRLEERTGKRFLVRMGSDGTGTRYMVTLATLREHHPDFFYRRDEAAETLRTYVEGIEERFEDLADRIEVLAKEVANRLQNIGERVQVLEGKRAA